MGCCGGASSTEPEEKKASPDEFFYKKRGCTDCFCFLLFWAFWAGLGYLSYLSITVGDPYSLLYGQDYLGNRCGMGTMAEKPAVYYPRIDQDLIAQAAIVSTMPWKLRFYGLCMEACPNVTTPETCFADPASCMVDDYGTADQYGPAGGSKSYYATMPSINLVNRCIPNDATSLTQQPDRCAFPQCDGATYSPCDTEYPTTWTLSFPASLECDVYFRTGVVKQLRPAGISTMSDALGSNVAGLQRIMLSITVAWLPILVIGVAIPIVAGFIWLVLLRLAAGIFTYIMITAIGAAMFCLTLYLYIRAGAVDTLLDYISSNSTEIPAYINITDAQAAVLNNSLYLALGAVSTAEDVVAGLAPSSLTSSVSSAESEVPALWWILAVIMSVLTLVYTISMCAARKQIKTAIALVKEASMVIKDRPLTMFFPFNTLVAQLAVCAFFLLLVLFLGTATITTEHFSGVSAAMTATSTFLDSMKYLNDTISTGGIESLEDIDNSSFYIQLAMYVYILFGFLWTIESFNNIGWTAMSGSVCHWYFFRDDPSSKSGVPQLPLLRSLWRVFRFHLGSVFFGSFIVALIQLIRILLMALDRYTKKQQDSNLLLKIAIKCTQCCLWCFEKTIKFITNYCYIYVAMQGAGFCKACFLTFSLIVTNPAQLSINTFVRTILSWIQLISLPVGAAWLCNIYLATDPATYTETIAPTVVCALAAYIIAKTFTLVFSCVLDTLFVCCCRDKAEFKGQFMPDRLKTVFGFKRSKKKKEDKGEEDKGEDKADADAEVEPQP